MIDKANLLLNKAAALATPGFPPQGTGVAEISGKFSEFLNEAVQKIEDQQKQVDALSGQFAAGQLADVHQLMIASEKSSLSLELTVQIRNKVVEAYQEIMRMQI